MLKVLLVEDNKLDAQLTQDLLAKESNQSFDLVHVGGLSEALPRLSRESFDVVLLDLSLPDGHGLDTLGQVQVAAPSLPVVVLSGLDDKELALQAVQYGAQDYLVKGQDSAEMLVRAIRYSIERKRAEERLIYLAQYDQLTGLANRALFRERLTQALARSKRKNQLLGLMVLDLDRFKSVNDSLGHNVGDKLLKAVADRLKTCVREVDTVARMGGDEFTVLLEGISCDQDVITVAKRILESIIQPLVLDGSDVHTSASIGVTIYPADDHGVDDLLKHADRAMYRAKEQGGNHYHLYIQG
jgi:two-component system cell cycle response regulator